MSNWPSRVGHAFRGLSASLGLVLVVAVLWPSSATGAWPKSNEPADVEVRAAHFFGGVTPGGTPSAPTFDPADCTDSINGTARYFVSVRSTTGVDINNAQGQLVFDPTSPVGLPAGTPTTQNLSNGDFES